MNHASPVRSPRWPAAGTCVLLALLTIATAGLRFAGLSRLLPMRPEPDDSLVHMYRELAGEPTPVSRLHFGVYPLLLPQVLTLVRGGADFAPAPVDASLDEHLAAAALPWVRVRALVALLSCLLVPLTFVLARRWLADRWALVAAAFIAVSLLHLAHSTVAKAHGAHASLAWLAIVCALRQVERTTIARCAATAGAALLAIGIFHTGFFTLLPLGAAAWLAWPQGAAGERSGRIGAWSAPVLACAGGLLFSPGGLGLGSDGIRLGLGHRISFSWLNGGGLGRWTRYLWEHDPALSALALPGLGVLLVGSRRFVREPRLRRDGLVIVAYALPYALLISLDRMVQDRYLLPLLPLFALAATLGLRALVGRSRGSVAFGLGTAVALAFPTCVALRLVWIELRPDTFAQTATWLEAETRGDPLTLRLSPNLSPPLFPDDAALAVQLATSAGRAQPWFAYLGRLPSVPRTAPRYDLAPLAPELFGPDRPTTPDGIAALLDRDAPLLVMLEISPRTCGTQGFPALRDLLRERGELAADFSGEAVHYLDPFGIAYQDVRDLARRLLTASALGPDIEIYRWPGR